MTLMNQVMKTPLLSVAVASGCTNVDFLVKSTCLFK